MIRRVLFAAIVAVVVFSFVQAPAFAQGDPDVFVSTGPTSEMLLGPGGTSFTRLFTAKGGFKPEEMALAGDGKLYICDSSNSEIFRFDPAHPEGGLFTIYDRNSAVSPNNPEQPKGCTVAGNDLLFLSRNGRGRGAKTGLWAIQNVTSVSPSQPALPTLLHPLDAIGGVNGQGLAVNFDGRVFFTFANEVWVATPQAGAGRIDAGSHFDQWGFTAGEGFGIATKGVPDLSGSLQTQVFVAAKFSGVIEVLEEMYGDGMLSDCSDISVTDMPNSLAFDGSGDLWMTTSAQSSGRRGAVYEIEAPACDAVGSVNLRAGDLSAAVGIALTPTGSAPVPLVFPEGSDKSNVVNMCNSTFNLDLVTDVCQDTWEVSCRLLPKIEFGVRTSFAIGFPTTDPDDPDTVQQDFFSTQCVDFPGASGNCTEIRIEQTVSTRPGEVPICTEDDIIDILANWQFFSLSNLDHPGLLYSPGDFETDGGGNPIPENSPFTENILVDFDPLPVPTDPLDPRATGSRDAWGSGIVVVDDAPNRPPTAVLTATPTIAQCGVPVKLDAGASFDNDWNVDHRDFITQYDFSVVGTSIAATVYPPLFQYDIDTTGLAAQEYTASVVVTDEGWDGALTDVADVTFEIVDDNAPPVISDFRLAGPAPPETTVALDGQTATMWSPHHDLRSFLVSYLAEDGCQAQVACELVIVSNQPATGSGEGDKSPDAIPTSPTTFDLRAERTPNEEESSRFYTVWLACSDGTNTSYSPNTITIQVPANQGGGG